MRQVDHWRVIITPPYTKRSMITFIAGFRRYWNILHDFNERVHDQTSSDGNLWEKHVADHFWSTYDLTTGVSQCFQVLGTNPTWFIFLLAVLLRDWGHYMVHLADPDNLNLCGDGTFRLVNASFVLVSIGVLSKVTPRGPLPWHRDAGYSTQFHELVLAICSVESSTSYLRCFDSFEQLCTQVCAFDPRGMATWLWQPMTRNVSSKSLFVIF